MSTDVIKIDRHASLGPQVSAAADVLDRGGLVAFPTETVYGVGARIDRPEAVKRLREIKSRSVEKAFTVHIADSDSASRFVLTLSGMARRMIRKGWPGPLTLVLDVPEPGATPIMAGLNGSAAMTIFHQKTVGLRCPQDDVARAILLATGAPLVAASANPEGSPAPNSYAEMDKQFGVLIDLAIDGGPTRYRKPSTIVRIRDDSYEVLREGVYDAGIIQRLAIIRILFVCTGNTCRSPMAEGLARAALSKRLNCKASDLYLRGILLESAGIAGGFGLASPHAVTVMQEQNIDISGHRSSHLSLDMIRQSDYIFTMTRSHLQRVVQMDRTAESRAVVLLPDEDVPDPVGGDQSEYRVCAKRIERGVRQRIKEVSL